MLKKTSIFIFLLILFSSLAFTQESDALFTVTVPVRLTNMHPSLTEVGCECILKDGGGTIAHKSLYIQVPESGIVNQDLIFQFTQEDEGLAAHLGYDYHRIDNYRCLIYVKSIDGQTQSPVKSFTQNPDANTLDACIAIGEAIFVTEVTGTIP